MEAVAPKPSAESTRDAVAEFSPVAADAIEKIVVSAKALVLILS